MIDKVDRLKRIYEEANKDVASVQDVANFATKILDAVKKAHTEMEADLKNNMETCKLMCKPFQEFEARLVNLINNSSKETSDKWYKELNNEVYKLEQVIANLEQYDDTQLESKFTLVIDNLQNEINDIKISIDSAIRVRDLLETLEGEDRLDISAIKGLDKELKGIKTTVVNNQGGGTMGIQLYVDGVLKGISKYVNLVAGSGITLTPTTSGESTVVTVSAVSGGGSETPVGDVDGVNTVFTFTRAPKVIIVDQGRTFILNNGFTVDGTGLIATVDVAPTFSIFSI